MTADHYYNKYGADLVRLWVSSVDYQNEVPFSEELFQQASESYRRLRNTLRVLLGNLDGFNAAEDAVEPDQLTLVDRWILSQLENLKQECREAYDAYDFRKVFVLLNQFCAVDLSALYVDITKDRLYCDATSSLRRRATQTAIHRITDASAACWPPSSPSPRMRPGNTSVMRPACIWRTSPSSIPRTSIQKRPRLSKSSSKCVLSSSRPSRRPARKSASAPTWKPQ